MPSRRGRACWRAGGGMAAPHRRKTVRLRSAIGVRAQQKTAGLLCRRSDLPHRSLSRQRDRAEHHGAALCQRHVRADLESPPYRSRANHRRRDGFGGEPRQALRPYRRAARHGAQSPVPAPGADRHGAAEPLRCRRGAQRKTRCARGHPPAQRCRRRRRRGARPVRRRPRQGQMLPAYREAAGVARESLTESDIAIKFRSAPLALFRDMPVESLAQNLLVLRIQPDEGAALHFNAKIPGPEIRVENVRMNFKYEDYFDAAPSTGYETLIYDCMVGDPMLFQRAVDIEAGWRVVDPILKAWRNDDGRDLCTYAAGSDGPARAQELLAHSGRQWRAIA